MSYMRRNFLLTNKTAERLYFDYAEKMPVFDYHCHLSEKQILENKAFEDLFEIWLAGDHYKWRLMRHFGVSEDYITGERSNKEKFTAYCTALGTAFGNPLYHWSQMELEAFFGCTTEINAENAEAIWEECNAYIRKNALTPQKLIEASHVKILFTTNEITDDLTVFDRIAEKDYKFRVIPAFRADGILNVEDGTYNARIDRLGAGDDLDDLMARVEARLGEFIKRGTVASDMAVTAVSPVPEKSAAQALFAKRRQGERLTAAECDVLRGYLTYALFRLYAKYDVAAELHVGAMRNNNAAMLGKIGANTGFDSIAEEDGIRNMSRLFDRLNTENALPRTVVFNLNPKMNAEIMALLGCFQSDAARGKMQYGPAWWFLDNKVGMEKHLADLTAMGHLGTFVGMLTDSRSFLSYPRHHYFRRILCNYLGTLMENGEMTANEAFVGKVVEDICYRNAIRYFGISE